jgi:predicted DNA-binding transcriptional regulator AlpA
MSEKYLTASQVADRYGVRRETIWRWNKADKIPKCVEVAGNARWKLSDLEKAESMDAELSTAAKKKPRG